MYQCIINFHNRFAVGWVDVKDASILGFLELPPHFHV
jgi:hypothetical protein